MSLPLLEAYVHKALNELHVDQKLKDLIKTKSAVLDKVNISKAKGIALRWSLERNIDLTPEIEDKAVRAYQHYYSKYGKTIAHVAVIQILDTEYNTNYVGRKSSLPVKNSSRKGWSPEREDDSESFGLVQSCWTPSSS